MPPVLDVTFRELVRGRAQQLFAGHSAFRNIQRHHILQLVAESVGATYLVETGASPHAARKRLVEEPAIQQHIHAGIGGGDFHRVEDFVPAAGDFTENFVQIGGAVAHQQYARLVSVFCLAQEKYDFGARAGAQFDRGLQRGARIQAWAHFAGEWNAALQRRGTISSAIAPEKFRAVASEGSLLPAQVGEGDAAAELAAPGAAREDGLRLRLDFRDDVWRRRAAGAA